MIFKGFKFGMLLQVAIGPVCIYVIKTAVEAGILPAEAAVLGATVMDTVFVTLAIIGVGSLLEKQGVRSFLKYFGAAVLIYFGLGIAAGSFGLHIIPGIAASKISTGASNAFVTSFILTASSPLSILFWTGVFATKLASEGYGKKEMILFGIGAVSATFVFLGSLALILGLLHQRIPEIAIVILNAAVGLVLSGFGIRTLLKNEEQAIKQRED